MTKHYSEATLLTALELRAAGTSYAEIKLRTGLSYAYQNQLYNGLARKRQSSTVEAAKATLATFKERN